MAGLLGMKLIKIKVDPKYGQEVYDWLMEQEDTKEHIDQFFINHQWKPRQGIFFLLNRDHALQIKLIWSGIID
jgi:hypothetical protein